MFSGLSFVSNEVPGVYNSIVLLLQKPTLSHTNTHTHNHTESERKGQKLVARFLKYPLGKIKHLKSEPDHYSLL